MDLQPIKKSGVYSIFGKHYGDYLTNFITGCCPDIGTLCTSIKHCIGIFPEGNPNLVLNQQGNWITSGGGDIQDLLSDLPEYLGAKEASEDGKPLGYWYYNTFYNSVSKVTQYINNYTSGTSTIGFTNNGGDDWDIDFKIAMSSQQLPSGYTAPNYDVNVYFYLSGTGNAIDSNTGVTIDKTVNASGNGAGVYVAQQVYNILDSNLSNVGIITISSLFKVNASGILLAYFICNGVVVNSVNGLVINVTADISQSENYPIEWYSYDSSFNPTLIGTGLTANLTLPTDCAYLIAQPILDSVFTVDFPNQSTNISTVTIN